MPILLLSYSRMDIIYLAKKKQKKKTFLITIPENAFQYIRKRTIFVICETSQGNMQEKLPPIFSDMRAIPARPGFSKSDNKFVLGMSKS